MRGRRPGLVVILDGLGDRPVEALRGATPLEAARTPRLDALAAEGVVGLADPLGRGITAGTQSGVAVLMGLDAVDARSLARGPVEAAGAGLDLRAGDVALRCNFATLQADGDGFAILDRRAGRIRDGTGELAEALADLDLGDGVTATVRPATQHRAVARLRGTGLAPSVSDTDPGAGAANPRVRPCEPLADSNPSRRTAEAVNRLIARTHARLLDHPVNRARVARGEPPANGLLTRGAGSRHPLRSTVARAGLRTAVVAGERTVVGLARLFGFGVTTDPRFTALPDTDVDAKIEAAAGLLRDHDLVYLHFKAPDICAHDLDPAGKRDFLERVDAALGPLLRDKGLVVGVSGDHATDSNTGAHCGDPVPSLLRAPGGRSDACTSFGERACARGALGRLASSAYLAAVLDALRR